MRFCPVKKRRLRRISSRIAFGGIATGSTATRCSAPGLERIIFTPGVMPANWSSQPPPVRISRSSASVSAPTRSTSISPPRTKPTSVACRSAAIVAAPRMDEVPIPLPFGKSALMTMSSPAEPNLKPVTASAAFTRQHQSPGSEWSATSRADLRTRLLPRSRETTLTRRSRRGETVTLIGRFPSSRTAAASTAPPSISQMGGVSDQPPARSMRTGAVTRTADAPFARRRSARRRAWSTRGISSPSRWRSQSPSSLKLSSMR